VLPAWFEEGLAAEIQAGFAGIDVGATLAARSLLANAPETLDRISTLADWHMAYTKIGVALYAVSAEAVSAIEARIGRATMFALLAEVGGGALFEDAYRARAGESLHELIARISGDVAIAPTIQVETATDALGNQRWTLGAFAPNSDVRVTIVGKSYDLAFTVRTDPTGMYRGTFGSTAVAGIFTLTAENAKTRVTATLDIAPR
jgi:hypothetical protein